MRRLTLTEFRTDPGVALSGDECDRVRHLSPGIRIEPTVGYRGRYDLTPDQRIGLICLPSLVIEVRPKMPMSSALFLISYGCDVAKWFDQYAEFAHDLTIVEALGIMLAIMIQHVTRRGLLNGYQSEEESLQAPRGRLLFDEQIRRRQGMTPPIEVRHDVYTSDILENRLLIAALQLVSRIPSQSKKLVRELFRAQRLFGAVKRSHFAPGTVPEVTFTRLNQHYQPAVQLAILLPRAGALDLGSGGATGCAFLIDMNKVFERFVRSALRDALGIAPANFPDRGSQETFGREGSRPA